MTLTDLTVGSVIGGLLACLVVGITLVASWCLFHGRRVCKWIYHLTGASR